MIPTKRIDRTFDGVGRIAKFSGTTDTKTFARINAMMSGLFNVGRLDVLIWIREGVYTPLEVLYHWERGSLDKLRGPDAIGGLIAALKRYQEHHEGSPSHKQDIGTSIRHMEKYATKAHGINDLPTLLRKAKDKMLETPVAFNRLRTHMLAFVSEAQGQHSPAWVAVSRVKRFKKAEGKRPQAKIRRPLTVAELDAVCAAVEDVPVHGGRKGAANKGKMVVRRTIDAEFIRHAVRFLATTGMRPQEYWQRGGATWDVSIGITWIRGTKTAAANRASFYISTIVPPPCGEQLFRRLFSRATKKALGLELDTYSLRRTFAKLCEDAGVVLSRRESYMGHGPKTVGDIYLRTEVLPFVLDDGEKVSQYMRAERERAAARPTLKLESK